MILLVAEGGYDCCYLALSYPAQRISTKLGETEVQVIPQKEAHFLPVWTFCVSSLGTQRSHNATLIAKLD